jgi:hypothetical protein
MEKQFITDDILLCSFLLTNNIELIDIEQDRRNHFFFYLSEPKKCDKLKHQYINNAPAPARQLFSQREMLISEIKARERNG